MRILTLVSLVPSMVAFGCGDAPLDTRNSDPAPVAANAQGDSVPGAGTPTGDSNSSPNASEPVPTTPPADERVPVPVEPAAEDPGCPVCEDIPALPSQTTYPIILAHGMGGFDEFGPLQYWVGVQTALREAGFAAYVSVVDPLNGSDVRATQLAGFVDRVLECTCAEKVNLIAHSQGGIDSRVLVNAMGYGDRIASVTTVASPHRGSPIADIGLGLVAGPIEPVVDLLAWMLAEVYTDPLEEVTVRAALLWCSSAHLAQFAEDYPDDPQVDWMSFAGRAGLTASGDPECHDALLPNPKQKVPLTLPLYATWSVMGGLLGVDNDGLVPVASARWGDFLGCVAADHVQEIGMFVGVPKVFDHLGFYRDQAMRLVERGH